MKIEQCSQRSSKVVGTARLDMKFEITDLIQIFYIYRVLNSRPVRRYTALTFYQVNFVVLMSSCLRLQIKYISLHRDLGCKTPTFCKLVQNLRLYLIYVNTFPSQYTVSVLGILRGIHIFPNESCTHAFDMLADMLAECYALEAKKSYLGICCLASGFYGHR